MRFPTILPRRNTRSGKDPAMKPMKGRRKRIRKRRQSVSSLSPTFPHGRSGRRRTTTYGFDWSKPFNDRSLDVPRILFAERLVKQVTRISFLDSASDHSSGRYVSGILATATNRKPSNCIPSTAAYSPIPRTRSLIVSTPYSREFIVEASHVYVTDDQGCYVGCGHFRSPI